MKLGDKSYGGMLKLDFSLKICLASTADKFIQTRFPSEVSLHIFTFHTHTQLKVENTYLVPHINSLRSYLYIKQEKLQRK